jgi:hypothetical protein
MVEDAAMAYAGQTFDRREPSEIEAVKEAHEKNLMAIDGVVGLAIGRTAIGTDALILYLRDPSVARAVPSEIDGYRVETVVTGPIDAFSSPER